MKLGISRFFLGLLCPALYSLSPFPVHMSVRIRLDHLGSVLVLSSVVKPVKAGTEI